MALHFLRVVATENSLSVARGQEFEEPSFRVPQKECGKRSSMTFFRFRDAFGHFSVTFSDASVTFSSLFCQTPFAGLLLRQGDS